MEKINMASTGFKLVEPNSDAHSVDWLASMMNKIATPVAYIDRNHLYRYVNKAFADTFGVDAAAITGRGAREFLGAKTFDAVRDQLNDVLRGNKVWYEQQLINSGDERCIVTTCTPDFDEEGHVKGYVAELQDISGQKKAERELQKSQSHYESMLATLPVAAYTCDIDGRITFFNQMAVDLWGFTPDTSDESVRFCAFHKAWSADGIQVEPARGPMAIALQTGISFRNTEILVGRPDGTTYYAIVNIEPLHDEDGKLCGAVYIFYDISDQKRAEVALRESEQKYRSLIQGLPAAIYTTDENGYITLYNKAAENMWGRSPVIGKELWCGSFKLYKPDGITQLALENCPMAHALREKKKIEGEEIVIERPDGSRKYIVPHPEPLFDTAGNVTGAVNMLLDITERKQAEEYRAKLAAIVQFSEDAIISKTTKGIVTSWNPAAEKLYGFTEEEMVGQPIARLIPPEYISEEPEILERIKKGERVDPFETKRITRNGRLIDISLTVSPVRDDAGNVIGASHIAHDISRRKEYRRLIHENSERLRMAVESTRLGTWDYQPLTGKLVWSNECRNIYDVPADLKVDFNFFEEHIYPEDKSLVDSAIQKAMAPGGDGNYDIQYRIVRHGDKQVKWIRAQGKAYVVNGVTERFIGTVLDITREKQQEEKLFENIELFGTMTDNVPAMIWMSGTDKFNDYFNKTWLEFTGRTAEEEGNEGWLEGVHPDDVKRCIDMYNNSLKEQEGFYVEYRLRRHDGQYRWIADNSTPRFSPDGEFIGFISACMDIDDQKRFREKILESELLFKTISSTSPAALWMTDQEKRTVFVNETWLKWTDGEFTDQLHFGWLDTLFPDEREKVTRHFFECFDKRKNFIDEFRIPTEDGGTRWCLTEGKPYFDISGTFAGYVGSVTDITEIKKLEQRKDDFIKMASHELKTPITSISGYVQLLLNIYNEAETEKLQMAKGTIRSSLGTIAKQVTKLSRLVSELLDLSRIESGKLELHCAEFDFNELVEEVVQDIRYTTTRHAIIVESSFEGKVYGDKDRIAQVLMNILNNAIKYSPAADRVDVIVGGNKKSAFIRVKDHGIGIDKKNHRRIFDRFYRVEGKKEQTYPGFGIGLFIADEIIRRHKGSIQVKSEKAKGSSFIINLPLDFRK